MGLLGFGKSEREKIVENIMDEFYKMGEESATTAGVPPEEMENLVKLLIEAIRESQERDLNEEELQSLETEMEKVVEIFYRESKRKWRELQDKPEISEEDIEEAEAEIIEDVASAYSESVAELVEGGFEMFLIGRQEFGEKASPVRNTGGDFGGKVLGPLTFPLRKAFGGIGNIKGRISDGIRGIAGRNYGRERKKRKK